MSDIVTEIQYREKLYGIFILNEDAVFYASNEPKSVLARDLGDCRDNLRNSRSVFLIVLCRGIYLPIVYFPCEGYTVKSVQFNALKLLIEKEIRAIIKRG